MTRIERAIAEQAECAAKLANLDYPDRFGAMRGVEDWLLEEVLARIELRPGQPEEEPTR